MSKSKIRGIKAIILIFLGIFTHATHMIFNYLYNNFFFRQSHNDSMISLVIVLFGGPFLVFVLTCSTSIVFRYVKNIDEKLREIFIKLPIYFFTAGMPINILILCIAITFME